MDDIQLETGFVPILIAASATLLLFFVVDKVPRTKGKRIEYHGVYAFCTFIILAFVPEFIHDILFNPTSVLVVGTIIPIYQSIKAVVSSDPEDDVTWVMFWIASGAFKYCTEWMDVVAEHYPSIAEYWYQIEFFLLLWFLLPFTDGSTFLFGKIIEPCFGDAAKAMKKKLDGKVPYFILLINSSYLWVIWFTFMTLDEEARRFVVVAVGTVYPIVASTVVCTAIGGNKSSSDKRDPTFWLTYWACFSILFLVMDYLEHFIGKIRGFYSICLCATVYLFLPMFQGSESIFRNVLVPLSGQYEAMFLRDIQMVKNDMMKKMPLKARERAFESAVALFGKEK